MSTVVEILDETLTDMRDNLVESYEEWGATMCDMLDGLSDDSPRRVPCRGAVPDSTVERHGNHDSPPE